MEEIKSGRSAGIDMTKATAVLFVLCVHFSLNTKYYKTPIADANMFVQSCFRWLFFVGVPLFIICTGFLNYKKTISRSYYLKIFRVLIPYALISILCLLKNQPDSFQSALFSIFNFTADSYSWYVNMYIGLFLVAPFLNIIVSAMDRQKFHLLLGSLLFIIALPAAMNPLLQNIPKLSYLYFPNWWQGFYPILYYFLGAYLAKFRLEIPKSICAAAILLLVCLQTGLQMLLNRYQFNNWYLSDYSSLFVVAESLALFLLIYSIDVKNLLVKTAAKYISMLSLEIYLFSKITDTYLYSYFSSRFYGPAHPMPQEMIFKRFFLIIVPLSFLSSLVLSLVFHVLYELGGKGLKSLMQKVGRRKAAPTKTP